MTLDEDIGLGSSRLAGSRTFAFLLLGRQENGGDLVVVQQGLSLCLRRRTDPDHCFSQGANAESATDRQDPPRVTP